MLKAEIPRMPGIKGTTVLHLDLEMNLPKVLLMKNS
jgi:hypothetical protein